MITQEREIVDFVNQLTHDQLRILKEAIDARELEMDAVALMKLPVEERARIMEMQAINAAKEGYPEDYVEAKADVYEDY